MFNTLDISTYSSTINYRMAQPLDASQMTELKAVLQSFLKKGEVLLLETKVHPGSYLQYCSFLHLSSMTELTSQQLKFYFKNIYI